MNNSDPHSYSNFKQVKINHSDINIKVNFDKKIISGKVSHYIKNINKASKIIFDFKNIVIHKITLDNYEYPAKYSIGEKDKILGQKLEVEISLETKQINIYYETKPYAEALQWLEPIQTFGKKHPFLFTQSQPILCRTWLPCQDTPSVRFTYSAKVEVPKGLMAVMSAVNSKEINNNGIYDFEMPQAIPSYLLALAVGNLRYRTVGENTGIYSEPDVIEKAAFEFSDMQNMVLSAEQLYGEYRWEQFDVLLLPPSFPFGGMENPRLTFATPTLLAGDKSLVNVIAHELAHSWSGNLITNATWNDFWLNEGFTVYFERRIMEKIYGKPFVEMFIDLAYNHLLENIQELGFDSIDTKLKLSLENRDPQQGLTLIPYEKGFFFLLSIEKKTGRKLFDKFLTSYFKKFAFQSITTETFIDFLNKELLEKNNISFNYDEWIYKTGLPKGCKKIKSSRFEKVNVLLNEWLNNKDISSEIKALSTYEYLHFLNNLPKELSIEKLEELDKLFNFSESNNAEILSQWLIKVIEYKFSKNYNLIEKYLINTGRTKLIFPIYKALCKTDKGYELAKRIYKKAKMNYHYISTNKIEKLFNK